MSTSPRQPLRVCHLAYTFHESDNRVMRYVRALAGRGDEVDVIALRPAGGPWRVDEPGVRVYQIQRRTTNERAAWMYLLKLLWFGLKAMVVISGLQLRRRYDVVHVHNVPDFLVFAAWLPRLMGARVVLDIHDMVPELYAGKFKGDQQSTTFRVLAAVERVCCAFAHHVIASNALWHERLTARSVVPARCSTFINFPDVDVFKPVPARGDAGDRPFVFLYPGSLNHHQGVDIAVRAFALVHGEMPGAEFHIYGRGPALPELKELVAAGGLGDVVKFMDFIPSSRMAEVMASASVGVVPKRADGFGNEAFSTKILEFMACGVPLIVARTRIDDYYFNDDLVTFFEPGDDQSLAERMLDVFRHRAQSLAKARAASTFAAEHSWQVRRVDYQNLVDGLVSATPHPARHQAVTR